MTKQLAFPGLSPSQRANRISRAASEARRTERRTIETAATLRTHHGRCWLEIGADAHQALGAIEGDIVQVCADGLDVLGIVGKRQRAVWRIHLTAELEPDQIERVTIRRVRRV